MRDADDPKITGTDGSKTKPQASSPETAQPPEASPQDSPSHDPDLPEAASATPMAADSMEAQDEMHHDEPQPP